MHESRTAMPPRQTNPRLLEDLKHAAAHHQAGRLDRAEALYLRVMRKMPDLAEPPYLVGTIAFDRGRHAYALQLADEALRAKKDFAPAFLLRGNALAELGRHAEAESAWRRVVELAPEEPAAHVNLALRLCETGLPDAALAHAQQALNTDPGLFRAHYATGLAMRQLNNPNGADTAFALGLRLAPNNIDLLREHGQVLALLGRTKQAISTLERALELSPCDTDLHLCHANALLDDGNLAAAECALRALLKDTPSAAAWYALGEMLRTTGRFEEAAQAYRDALVIAPLAANALAGLASIKAPLLPGDITLLEQAAHATNQPTSTRASLLHALGRRHEAAEQHDLAFASHAEANALVRSEILTAGNGFNAARLEAEVDVIIASWTASAIARLAAAAPHDPLPVFIVGLPRSGSTLVEQIIASHPDAHGEGERLDIATMTSQLRSLGPPDSLEPTMTAAMASAHLDSLAKRSCGATRVIDKQLDNLFHLGVIGALFPGARVLLCQRDLRDQGLSCFFQEFLGPQNEYLELTDIGQRAVQTERLARHWLANPPVPMMAVRYEDVVNDLEGQARAIIDFLGLPWNPACLDFHHTVRRITTSSAWQVRQPLYDRSVGRWRLYEQHLTPLLDIIGNNPGLRSGTT
jgi:tetratricopeptide (TPR) repeat protein